MEAILGICVVLLLAVLALCILLLSRSKGRGEGDSRQARALSEMEKRLNQQLALQREAADAQMARVSEAMAQNLRGMGAAQRQELQGVNAQVLEMTKLNRAALEEMRNALDANVARMMQQNAEKLEQMRSTVDEKLHTTLDKRLNDSFGQVSQRLEQVYKGLGEMNRVASQMDDLQRVLKNVKVRGTWGEVQLGALIEQILSPAQYRKNTPVKPGGRERVEFAICLPDGPDGAPLLLPIDAKFPQEDYLRLVEASQLGDVQAAEAASKQLENTLLAQAKQIQQKYIQLPHTTDFAILYLPTEGLYAEAVRRDGLLTRIQARHRVTVAGPSTLTALLNSLQMGFQTLAVQRSTDDIRKVFEQFEKDFALFTALLDKTRKNLDGVIGDIDKATKRTQLIDKRLQAVRSLDCGDAAPQALPLEHE